MFLNEQSEFVYLYPSAISSDLFTYSVASSLAAVASATYFSFPLNKLCAR